MGRFGGSQNCDSQSSKESLKQSPNTEGYIYLFMVWGSGLRLGSVYAQRSYLSGCSGIICSTRIELGSATTETKCHGPWIIFQKKATYDAIFLGRCLG